MAVREARVPDGRLRAGWPRLLSVGMRCHATAARAFTCG